MLLEFRIGVYAWGAPAYGRDGKEEIYRHMEGGYMAITLLHCCFLGIDE